jgi:hypothetical protein
LNTNFYVKILVGSALGSALGGAKAKNIKPNVLDGGALGGALLTIKYIYNFIKLSFITSKTAKNNVFIG